MSPNASRAFALGALADVCVAVVGVHLAVGVFVSDNVWHHRFEIPALALLTIVALSGHSARRGARRATREALEAREQIAESARRRDSFLELSESALRGIALDDLFAQAAAMLVHHLGASHAGVFQLRADQGDLVLRAGAGWPAGAVGTVSIGLDPESHAHPTPGDQGIVHGLSATLHRNGSTFGALAVHATTPGRFSAVDESYLELVASLLTNILRRSGAEAGLRESEERLRLALELTQIGTWDDDVATGKGTWSRGLCDIFGVDPEGDHGFDAFASHLHPDDRDRVTGTLAKFYAAGGEYEIEDYQICRDDGEVRSIYVRGNVLTDEAGTPVRAVGVALDVTDRRRSQAERSALEEQLRTAQKMEAVGQLAGGIAHDFNNLLLALRGYGEVALRALARGEDAQEEVEEMLASAERAAALTRQLLAFSRRQILQPQVVDLNSVISELEKLLARLIGEDVEVTTVPAPEPTCVYADHGQLEQVIANLALNARDAMPDGGTLTIEVAAVDVGAGGHLPLEPGRYAVLSVSDTGCGMDPETAAQIFEPFFTTKDGLGTGLGLSTVHGIVQQSGGHVYVYSEPGVGTTFKIYLSLVEDSPRPKPIPQPAPEGAGETILLVEDDAAVRTFVRQMLLEQGYNVLTAEGGEEAIELAGAQEGIDLVLTDVVMRGLNGRETVERLRETEPDIAVLYMSGYTDDAVLRRGVIERGTAFLQKPFGSDDLARKVRQVLDA